MPELDIASAKSKAEKSTSGEGIVFGLGGRGSGTTSPGPATTTCITPLEGVLLVYAIAVDGSITVVSAFSVLEESSVSIGTVIEE